MNQQGLVDSAVVDPHMFLFITNLACVLADHKEKVVLESIPTSDGFELTLKVAATDMPWIVGHKKNTLDAIGLLLKAVGTKHNARISFSVASHP